MIPPSFKVMLLLALASQILFATALPLHERDTGCDMTPNSPLMQCLGNEASVPPSFPIATTNGQQASSNCQAYQRLADCWAQGLYCREWQSMQIAADKLCALANVTTPIPTATLSSVQNEASNVITSIWNDDSGTAIPSITNDIDSKTEPTWTYEGTSTSTGAVKTSSPSSTSPGGRIHFNPFSILLALGVAVAML